ncbi:MAG: hypothetical protein GXP48_12010 [Acidobacteria bacterium]|nr:hypothetical protein [Acidobacteriota bacterium]
MIDRAVLRRLHRLTDGEPKTLTMYVDIDQNKTSNRRRGFETQAEAMLKEMRSSEPDDKDLAKAASVALNQVKEVDPRGRTALVVVNTFKSLAETHQVRVAIPPSVHWRRGAHLRPIVEALDEHERYAVVLSDKNRARIFMVFMGEIMEYSDLISATSMKTQTTGMDQWWSQKRFQRRHDNEVTLHVKRVVDALYDLSLRTPFDRLLVAGPTEAASELARLLPTRLHGKLVKTLSMSVSASPQEVLERTLETQREIEREQELEQIEGLFSELHEGGKAISGLEPVIDAANQGRIWKLFYVKDLEANGAECTACGAIAARPNGTCQLCGATMRPVSHIVDRLTQITIAMGGHVEMVDGPAADKLKKVDEIAALLRY